MPSPAMAPIPARRGFPTGFLAVFLVTCLLFAITVATVADSLDSDAAGNAITQSFAAMFAVALWIALATSLLMATVGGATVRWASAGLLVLVPASAVGCFLAIGRFGEGERSALISVIGLPLLLILYAGWARFPALHAMLRPVGTSAALLGLATLLAIGTIVVDFHARLPDPKAEAKRAEAEKVRLQAAAVAERRERERETAAFDALGPDSPLGAYLPYLRNRAFADRALEKVQTVKTRQEDAIQLLGQRPLGELADLWEWNLLATHEMCEAYGNAFLAAADRITKARSDYLTAAIDLEWQMPNLKWMIGSKCDLSGPLERAEANIKAVADSDRLRNLAITLGELKRAR